MYYLLDRLVQHIYYIQTKWSLKKQIQNPQTNESITNGPMAVIRPVTYCKIIILRFFTHNFIIHLHFTLLLMMTVIGMGSEHNALLCTVMWCDVLCCSLHMHACELHIQTFGALLNLSTSLCIFRLFIIVYHLLSTSFNDYVINWIFDLNAIYVFIPIVSWTHYIAW